MGRTLISRNAPPVRPSSLGAAASVVGTYRDLGTKLLLASIVCGVVAFVLAALLDIGVAVGGFGVAGVLFYVGHWMVS